MVRTTQEIDDIIANSNRLIEEAREVLEQGERFFAEHDIDPREALEYVRAHGGEEALRQIEAQVNDEIRRAEEEAVRQRLHTPKARTAAQRPRIRSNMV